MLPRQIIRMLVLLPALVCAVVWIGSYFSAPFAVCPAFSRYNVIEASSGGIFLLSPHASSYQRWRIGSENPGGDFPHAAYPRFLGFSISEFGGFNFLRIPMWFPTVLSLTLLLLIYRKTRPRKTFPAFPVETPENPPNTVPTHPPSTRPN